MEFFPDVLVAMFFAIALSRSFALLSVRFPHRENDAKWCI